MFRSKILKKRKVSTIGILILLFGISFFLLGYGFSQNNLNVIDEFNSSEENSTDLKTSIVVSPIIIDDTVPGSDWAWAVTQAWCTGSGIEGDPYILEFLEIDGLMGNCITIQNSKAYFTIRACRLYNGYYAIYLYNVGNGSLISNDCDANTYGIFLDSSSYNEMLGNVFYGDTSGTGINLYNSSSNLIEGNFVENHYQGIRLDSDCIHNTILENTAYNNSNYGILVLWGSNNNTVTGNICDKQKYACGIILAESNYNDISENTASNNPMAGIALDGSSGNHLANNIIFNNAQEGIHVRTMYTGLLSQNNRITMNTIYNNTNNGILLNNNCSGNWIWDNDIYANEMDGISLVYGTYTTCWGNSIHDNKDIGIYVGVSSANNLFYKNFLFRNDKHAVNLGTNIGWDNGAIGNYWDNYTGPDANDDGIGDIPHNFGTGIDYLPIVEDGIPQITIISPLTWDVFDDAPSFDIIIDEDYLVSMWYTIESGVITYPFTGFSGIVDQVAWDSFSDGSITITFYANDKVGNIGFAEVSVIKDTQAPIIVCNSPEEDEEFGNTAPSFDLTVIDLSLDEILYSVDGGSTNFTVAETGTIDQGAWATLPNGEVTITFYAKDKAGHLGITEVTVQKKATTTTDTVGLDYFITSILILMFSGVAIIIVIAKVYSKKRII
ncbi:MAG: nitrous oxide reductase family maturation protein NosD [Candidatus Thorarchaeota archaeon]